MDEPIKKKLCVELPQYEPIIPRSSGYLGCEISFHEFPSSGIIEKLDFQSVTTLPSFACSLSGVIVDDRNSLEKSLIVFSIPHRSKLGEIFTTVFKQ